MDTSLTHLPENKQKDLARVVALIREHCPAVGMIILFGSYARGGWKEAKDLAPDRRSGHASDYDILAVTGERDACDAMVWHRVAEACAGAGLSASARIISHGIDYLNIKLARGHYFFSDIVAEGKLLYDAGTFSLAEPKPLSPEERLEIARRDFEHWFQRAEQFLDLYTHALSKGWREVGAFNLHQAAESAYKTMLLVFTGYIPDEHYLAELGRLVTVIDPGFGDCFPSEDSFQIDAFALLEYAYVGARYDKRYSIDEASLNYLAERVVALLALTGERCREKIALLAQAAKA